MCSVTRVSKYCFLTTIAAAAAADAAAAERHTLHMMSFRKQARLRTDLF